MTGARAAVGLRPGRRDHRQSAPSPSGESVDDQTVAAILVADETQRNVERLQLLILTEAPHVGAELFDLVGASSPAKAFEDRAQS